MSQQNWKNLSNELRRRASQGGGSGGSNRKSPFGAFAGIGGILLIRGGYDVGAEFVV